ncbi:MAG: PAS domain S-box protein [Bacillota bacterium]
MVNYINKLNEEHYKDLVENASDFIQCVDGSGKFIYVNKAWKEKLGYADEEIENLSLWNIIHPQSREHCEKIFKQVISGKGINAVEAIFMTKSGRALYVEGSANCRFDAAGNIICTRGIFRDITQRKQNEEELRTSREMLQKVINNIPQLIFWKDRKGVYLGCNNNFARIAGVWSPKEIIGKTDYDLVWSKEDADSYRAYDEQVMSSGKAEYRIIESYLKSDKKFTWVEINKIPLFSAQGKVVGILGTIEDVTERLKIEAALKESEAKYRALVSNVPGAIFQCKNDRNWTMEYISQEIEAITGYQASVFINNAERSYTSIIYEEDREFVYRTVQKGIEKKQPYKLDYRLVHASGTIRWISENAQGVFDDEGNFLFIIGIIIDVTEYKKTEEALYRSEAKYRSLVENLNEIVYLLDTNTRILYVSPNIEALSGYSLDELNGKSFIDFVHPEDKAERIEEFHKALAGKNKATEYRFLTKEKNCIWIRTKAKPIIKDGRVAGVQGVLTDITDRKKAEEEIYYLSYHDYLTGLYNRRYMKDAIIRMDIEENLPFAIMVLDVNGLKLTNDAFGHKMGDKLLRRVACIMTKACRKGDIIARIGGDEFAILLPKTDISQAKKIKANIINEASKTTLDSVVVSLSIGCAVKEKIDQDIDEIYLQAENYMYKNKLKSGKRMRNQTIETVIRNINSKYDNEQIHNERVSQYCEAIGVAMGLSKKEINDIKTAGILHDIGKIMVPAELLSKPAKLLKKEFELIKKHPETGYHILKSVDEYAALAEYVLYHHERWDGKGYPEGLKGEEIPLISRIISVADAYEAMTAKRPYKKNKSKEEAIAELKKCAGTQFDSEIVHLFVEKVLNDKS